MFLVMNGAPVRKITDSLALRVALIYFTVASLWILLSDRAIEAVVRDPEPLGWLQTTKGWAFVLVTAALLYVAVHRSAQRLRESRRFLATVLSNLPGMVYRCRNDEQWTMEFVSEGCHKLTGYAPSELKGNASIDYASLIHEKDREAVWDGVQAAVRESRPFQLVYRIKTKDGQKRWVWEQGCAVDSGNKGVQVLEGFITDITENRELERQLQVAQKLEALGRLAGGVTHDFNNLLTVISGCSEMLLDHVEEDEPLRAKIDEIRHASERAAGLTRQLLAFSRREQGEPKVLDLNSVVTDVNRLLVRLLGEDVEIRTRLDPQGPRIKIDPGQVEQIIMNLAINARDAMTEGNRLTIETGQVTLDEDYVRRHPEASPGPQVVLTVSDTGCGMDAETRARIFDPFFTTKEPGKGTGLGLSTVYGAVKQSGGHISVYSELGLGTTFRIYFPAIEAAVQAPESETECAPHAGGTETVLLVEDEEPIRDLVCEYLRLQGFTVLAAPDGDRALELLQGAGGRVDVLATDLVLPGMTGCELAQRIQETAPEIRVLLLSGYAENEVVRRGLVHQGTAFLQKPFQLQDLAARLRKLLDEPAVEPVLVKKG